MHELRAVDDTITFAPLLHPQRLFSRSECMTRPSPVPDRAGVYAWYFREAPDRRIDTSKCHHHDGLPLLYVGIAPKEPPLNGQPPSKQTLRRRIRQHYCRDAYGSTLRLTLGCLLGDELGITLRRVGGGNCMTFTREGEARLSTWMGQNALVTWVEAEEPWFLEEAALAVLDLPLNLRGGSSAFRSVLVSERAAARERARALPILPR